jgi:hypothetical protein
MLPAWNIAHPLHLSITNIAYENGLLKVEMKTFRDDWETAYFHYHSKVIDFSASDPSTHSWFGKYLFERFQIAEEKGDSTLSLSIKSIRIEEDAMTIQLEGRAPDEPKSLYIYNALLTDIFPDQTNLVIFGFKNKESGIKFDVKKQHAEVVLN